MEIKKIVVGPLMTNCYLLYNKEEVLVVDPGGDGEKIIEEVEKINLPVKNILNTHSHFDHTMANRVIEEYSGKDLLKNLKEGDLIEIGEDSLKVLFTPGHTEDSICILGEDFLIGGDVLFKRGYGRTDLPGGSDKKMIETLKRLKKEVPSHYRIYPGHGESFLMREWDY